MATHPGIPAHAPAESNFLSATGKYELQPLAGETLAYLRQFDVISLVSNTDWTQADAQLP